ncbi:hypothetical protein GOP47_0019429 [Adiantum capillus-veneris]|uniref:SKA complex subunit 1 homolog n=1 Tax=Adiantum capillus-veneris TaxID=13818 RepID=A0A9D4Z7T9_ADICA|nr:hypothetical protein GOP47_0019429 [Adiantum capillus-veneris]
MEAPTTNPKAQTNAHSLEAVMSAFNNRISFFQQVLVARSALPGSTVDLATLDIAVQAMEHQLRAVKARLQDEADALPKAKALIELSLQQERRLKLVSSNLPANLPGSDTSLLSSEHTFLSSDMEASIEAAPTRSMDYVSQKEKKGRGLPPRLYVTIDEFESLSSYMRGRLTLEKINAAVDEMATFAEANARLLAAPRKKLGQELLERALELRDFATFDNVKGKHFFFESDMRGPVLKMDNTGKAILTVLRHLGRISDVRTGRHRAFLLSKA